MSLAARVAALVLGALAVGFTLAVGSVAAAIGDWARDHPDAVVDDLIARTLGPIAVAAGILVLAAIGAFLLVRRGTVPLRALAQLAQRVAAGDYGARVTPAGPPEAAAVGVRMNAMLDELQRALAEREASELTTRQFLADASHELRTPLATVRGYAELFRRGAADRPDDLAKAMDRIEEESRRMTRLVEGLLRLSRAGEAALPRTSLDLAEAARTAVADFAARHPAVQVDLEVSPASVLAARDDILQLVGNLLDNAAQHAPGAPVLVRVAADGQEAVLTVDDGGPGIPAAERAHMLSRLTRGPSGGNGLGLAIVAAIARTHDATVTITNAPLGGARCAIRLPRQQ